MAQLPPLVLPLILLHMAGPLPFGDCLQVILGDPVTFSAPAICVADEPAELYRLVGQRGARVPVARFGRGVWTASEGYSGRVHLNSSFGLSRAVYADTGLYQFVCGRGEENMQLDVVVGFAASVTEGDPVTLPCYYISTGKHVDSVRWVKNEALVLERSLSSGETRYGAGFQGRASLSPGGDQHGDWSLVWDRARREDGGDYFCSVLNKGVREGWGDPAATRVEVNERNPDGTTPRPPRAPTQSAPGERMGTGAIVTTTAAVTGLIVAPLCFLLARRPNPCGCTGPGGGAQYAPVGQANGAPPQANGAPPQANGAPPQANGAPPQANGAPPQANGDPPQANGAPPQANGDPPQANGDPPLGLHISHDESRV